MSEALSFSRLGRAHWRTSKIPPNNEPSFMFDFGHYREQSSEAAQGQVLSDQCAPLPGGHGPPREAEGSADVVLALLVGALSRRGAGSEQAARWCR